MLTYKANTLFVL